jgi:hypothetical protein
MISKFVGLTSMSAVLFAAATVSGTPTAPNHTIVGKTEHSVAGNDFTFHHTAANKEVHVGKLEDMHKHGVHTVGFAQAAGKNHQVQFDLSTAKKGKKVSHNLIAHVNGKFTKQVTNLSVTTKVGKKGSEKGHHPDSGITHGKAEPAPDADSPSTVSWTATPWGWVHFDIFYFMGFDPWGNPIFAVISFDMDLDDFLWLLLLLGI